MPEQETRQIGVYRLEKKLGAGGMGVVYKAEDTTLDRLVALKFLPSHLNASDQDKARFVQEAKAAAALNHPNICTILDIGDADGQAFIAMDGHPADGIGRKRSRGDLTPIDGFGQGDGPGLAPERRIQQGGNSDHCHAHTDTDKQVAKVVAVAAGGGSKFDAVARLGMSHFEGEVTHESGSVQ